MGFVVPVQEGEHGWVWQARYRAGLHGQNRQLAGLLINSFRDPCVARDRRAVATPLWRAHNNNQADARCKHYLIGT